MRSFALGVLTLTVSALARPRNITLPPFPQLKAEPHVPTNWDLPAVPNRERVCLVEPTGTEDVGPAILEAAHECNKGGTVYLPEGEYTLSSALDLTFLDHIDFAIYGTLTFNDDLDYWRDNAFKYTYQSVSLFWRFGGTDVNIYGGGAGVLDGKGQTYWTAMLNDTTLLRPCMWGTDGLHRSTFTGFTFKDPPAWANFVSNSTNVLISDIILTHEVTDPTSRARNTDGWDTYRSRNIVIQNSKIVNTDDCVSFKPNSTAIIVQGLDCTGSHGISVGSLGQHPGQVDIVEDVYVYNVTMRDATDVARIKVWAGVPPENTSGTEGGGSGLVRNITYDTMYSENNAFAIALTACYFAESLDLCAEYPSGMLIDDIKWLNFYGTTSGKNDPKVGDVSCGSPDSCTNFEAQNINITPPSGEAPLCGCFNFDTENMNLTCVAPA